MYSHALWLIHYFAACAICVGGLQVLVAVAAVVCRDACCRRLASRSTPSP
jgi:hypothetical protein